MKNSTHQLFLGAAVAIFFTLTFSALAQEKPTPPPEPAAQATPAATPAPATPAPGEPAPAAPAEGQKQPELRRVDAAPAPDESVEPPDGHRRRSGRGRIENFHLERDGDNAIVSVAHDSFLAKDQKADAVISI